VYGRKDIKSSLRYVFKKYDRCGEDSGKGMD
jgi:hypothetical protein